MPRLLGLLLLTLAAVGTGAGLVLAGDASGQSEVVAEAEPVPSLQLGVEPTFLTLLNFGESAHLVRLETLSASGLVLGSEVHRLGAGDALTLPLDLATVPVTFRVSCGGCATSTFGLAASQRVLVFIDVEGSPLTVRTDFRVFNEGATRLQGVVRTGSDLGRGRTLLAFDLAPGEEARVGIRLQTGATIELNLTCPDCASQRIRLGNGVDLEVPLR